MYYFPINASAFWQHIIANEVYSHCCLWWDVCSVEVSGGGEDEGVRGFRVLKYSVSCGNRFGLC